MSSPDGPRSGDGRSATRRGWLGMLALAGLLVGLAVFVAARPDSQAIWTAGAARPLVDEWASFTEAGSSGDEISAESRPSRITQVTIQGRKAYRFTVLARDRDRFTSNAQRTELGQGNPSRRFTDGTGSRKMAAGQERWVAESILIPRGAPTGSGGYGFFVINQFKLDGPGGPAAALDFEHGRLVARRASSRDATSTDQEVVGRTPVVARDRWLKILWHFRWSPSSDGLIEAFADVDGKGLRRFARYRGWTLKNSATDGPALVHPRVGIYRRTIRQDTSIYLSGFAVAADRGGAESGAGF